MENETGERKNERGNVENKQGSTKDSDLKLILRIVCITVCTIGFLFQSIQLFSVYFSGKTVVENRLERVSISPIPALTICLPTFISMDSYSQKYPELRDLYNKYTMALDNPDKELNLELYGSFIANFIEKHNIIDESFGEISMHKIDLKFNGSTAFDGRTNIYDLTDPNQYSSISLNHRIKKCFTVFTQLDVNYRYVETKLRQVQLLFTHNNSWFPVQLYDDDFYISIHSPNNLPEYKQGDNFKKFDMNYEYSITFSEIHTKLLPPPYQTNCKTYQNFGKTGDQYMRSDCIHQCFANAFIKECGLSCISYYENFNLLRKEALANLSKLPYCHLFHEFGGNVQGAHQCTVKQLEMAEKCDSECPNNCNEIFYALEVDKIGAGTKNSLSLTLRHNQLLDQLIEHKPVMNVITLFSDFGGLLGLWLGLSIVSISDYILNIISTCLNKNKIPAN